MQDVLAFVFIAVLFGLMWKMWKGLRARDEEYAADCISRAEYHRERCLEARNGLAKVEGRRREELWVEMRVHGEHADYWNERARQWLHGEVV